MAQSARDRARENAKRRAEEQSHGGGGFSIKLPEGVKFLENKDGKKIELDFLPFVISDKRNPDVRAGRAKVGDWADARFYWQHGNIGVDQRRVICLSTIGERCPVCEEIEIMRKNPHIDPKEIESIKKKERVLYNVIDVNEKGQPIRVWDVSYYLFTQLLENDQKDREERYDYFMLEGGLTLSIRFESKTMGKGSKPFYAADRIDYDKRPDYKEDILKEVVDLDAALNIMSYDQLKAMMMGGNEPNTDTDDAPPPARERGSRERGSRDEEPAREERGRDDKEDAPPARGRGRARDEEPEPSKGSREERGGRERGRGRDEEPQKDDSVHDRNPDAPGERERHDDRYRGELDTCPGEKSNGKPGVFGEDTDKLDYCDRGNGGKGCDKWDDCRREKSAREKESDKGGRGRDEKPSREKEPEGRETRGGRRR